MLLLIATLLFVHQSPQAQVTMNVSPAERKLQVSSLADECGDPIMVSDSYASQNGKVTRILGPNVLEVVLEGKRRHRITLVGTSVRDLGGNAKDRAQAELRRVALGREVEVWIHGSEDDERSSFAARVFVSPFGDLSHGGELNLVLMELGLVRYVSKQYALDWWTACHYERAESEAKRNPRGVWSQGSEARSN